MAIEKQALAPAGALPPTDSVRTATVVEELRLRLDAHGLHLVDGMEDERLLTFGLGVALVLRPIGEEREASLLIERMDQVARIHRHGLECQAAVAGAGTASSRDWV